MIKENVVLNKNTETLEISWMNSLWLRSLPSLPIIPSFALFFFVVVVVFYSFLAVPCSLWDLSSPNRNQTHTLGSESTES